MAKASLILGIFAILIGLAPLLSGWFLMFIWLVWILAILSVVFGVIGIVKKKDLAKCIVGIVLSVFAILSPRMFEEQMAENAVESVSNAASFAVDVAGAAQKMSEE